MTPGLARRLAAPALAALIRAASAAAFAQAPAPSSTKAPVPPPPFATTAGRAEAGVRWQSLSPAQRQALAPLERDWSGIDAQRKQKWLQIADRYPSLPPQEQARIAERMNEWARLTPAQRGEMRLRYPESQQVPDRSAKWQEYQNLPPESKQQFADRAASSSAPARPDFMSWWTVTPQRSAWAGIRVGGPTRRTLAPRVCSRATFERATRLCSTSPQIATVRPEIRSEVAFTSRVSESPAFR